MISTFLTINTDGGSRGNPGPAAWAFVVKEDGTVIHSDAGYMGVSTNNRAEYMGVLRAMEWLGKNSPLIAGPVAEQPHDHPLPHSWVNHSQAMDPDHGAPRSAPPAFSGKLSTSITFILDSELVARQLSGVYKIKDSTLMQTAQQIKVLEKKVKAKVLFTSVPRAENKEADALVNQELDRISRVLPL